MTVGDKSLQPIYLFRAPYSFFGGVSDNYKTRTSYKRENPIFNYNLQLASFVIGTRAGSSQCQRL